MELAPRTHWESVEIAATPQQVYELVSDVTRTGEWSPICRRCEWDEGDGPRVGAHFTGHNEHGDRVWSTRSEVVAAEPGREFSWMVGDGYVRWGYLMEPANSAGTRTTLTETWEFRRPGLQFFLDRFGEDAPVEADARETAAREGIPATLAAIKRILEG